eukprot:m.42911 g.42911  ORF g.42911 m.42911 type:complete len:244 (+) comp9928_c0_seq1:442-1173(+)
MKLLDVSELAEISNFLSGTFGDVRLTVRLEAYSCKMVGEDKRYFKILSSQENVDELESLSPSPSMFIQPGPRGYLSDRSLSSSVDDNSMTSPEARQQCSKRTLYYLKSTLNAVFSPDYDFTNARSHEFSKETNLDWVQRNISVNLRTALLENLESFTPSLWKAIDRNINVPDCDIYSYNPDLDSDPFGSDGCLWCFNYFWYNKKLKRIIFFRGRCVSQGAPSFEDELDTDEMDSGDDGLQMEL